MNLKAIDVPEQHYMNTLLFKIIKCIKIILREVSKPIGEIDQLCLDKIRPNNFVVLA